jgi:hypothetical protein
MAFEIERCNSLLQADAIKALFLRNERRTFPAFFDRAYPIAMAAGGCSWIARNPRGAVVGHLAAFPRLFRSSGQRARAALFVDLLVDGAHRNFWCAVELCRRAAADLRAAGDFDFAFTDPTPVAQLVLRAAGFAESDALERFVAPLHTLYTGLFRIAAPAERLLGERVGGTSEARVAEVLRAMLPGPYFRAERSLELYAARLGGDTIAQWEWLVLRPRRDAGAPDAAVAVTARQPGSPTLSIVDLVWDDRRVSVASVLQAVIDVAQQEGYGRLSIASPARAAFTIALRRRGFIRRADVVPLLVLPLSHATLPPLSDWFLTYLDSSAW